LDHFSSSYDEKIFGVFFMPHSVIVVVVVVVVVVVFCTEMSELLFECYCIPRVAYGIDALFSYYYSMKALVTALHGGRESHDALGHDALIVSCGYHATHVLPVLNDRLCGPACQRINVGGSAIDGFMQRVLQLKYPQHISSLSLNRAEV